MKPGVLRVFSHVEMSGQSEVLALNLLDEHSHLSGRRRLGFLSTKKLLVPCKRGFVFNNAERSLLSLARIGKAVAARNKASAGGGMRPETIVL